MSVVFLIFNLLSANPSWWGNFCEEYLVAEDPYQYEALTVDQLVGVYWRFKNEGHKSKALVQEMKIRLLNPDLSYEDREILTKTMNN